MKDYQNTVILLVFLSFTIISIFAVSAEDLNNTTFNDSNNLSDDAESSGGEITPMSIFITLNLNTTNVNLGSLMADNQLNSYPSTTQVSVTAWLPGELYIRASGDLTNGTNTSRNIPLNYFQYDGFNNAALDHKPFTTTATQINSWNGLINDNDYNANYYLTVPYGTDPAVYNVTVIYSVA